MSKNTCFIKSDKMPPVRKISRSKTLSETDNEELVKDHKARDEDEKEDYKEDEEERSLRRSPKTRRERKQTEGEEENQPIIKKLKEDSKEDNENDKPQEEENKKLETNDDVPHIPLPVIDETDNTPVQVKRGRGRPRKYPLSEPKMPIRKPKRLMLDSEKGRSESEIKLRRRDKIKVTERYSPEIHEPKRTRRSTITLHSNNNTLVNYIDINTDDEELDQVTSQSIHPHDAHKKLLLRRSSTGKNESGDKQLILLDLKPNNKDTAHVIVTLADGRAYTVDKSGSTKEEINETEILPRSLSPTKRKLLKLHQPKILPMQVALLNNIRDIRPGQVQATGIKMPKMIRKATKQQQLLAPHLLDDTTSGTTTKISAGHGKTVTYITTPKSVTLTPACPRSTNKRAYGSNAKFLNEVPDLSECSAEDLNSSLEMLCDRILFISSDLPLEHSLMAESNKSDYRYLFAQIISSMTQELHCLLCNGSKHKEQSSRGGSVFKDEQALCDHYESYHELLVEHEAAKFSEDIVFVCLPQSVIKQLQEDSCAESVLLNAPCQYCGDEVKLATMKDMQTHYEQDHGKEIRVVEQELILQMPTKLHCIICQTESNDFVRHHEHMKREHKLHTLVCRGCVFTTSDAQRLSTHFRAKHLIVGGKSQNMQCNFCNGICIGMDRMNKHLISVHCVQTGPDEYSCIGCLQPHESGEQLLQHSLTCPGREQNRDDFDIAQLNGNASILKNEKRSLPFSCFLCELAFDTQAKYDLHLHHVHARWSSRVILNDTFLMVQRQDGRTDLMPSKGEEFLPMSLSGLPSNKQLEEIGARTSFGYYCHKCECVIRIYQLFYLHMFNLHKLQKQFECRLTECKQNFSTALEFEQHVRDSSHPQFSVIERPLHAVACHTCDAYFLNEKEMETHNLSDDHHARLSKSMEKSTVKTTEARNFKCKTCHTWFGLMDSFVYHMENESHKHGCPHCGLHFALPSSRRTHIQSVHADKADICELCNERQGTKERLFAHLVDHNLVFECDKCMRKFYQREQLNNHMETHGEPVDCPWPKCGRRINRASLSIHYRAHKIENQLRCKTCEKVFSTKQQLNAHNEAHSLAEQKTNNVSSLNSSKPLSSVSSSSSSRGSGMMSSHAVATTLISITTPPTSTGKASSRTYLNRTSAGNQNPRLVKSPTKYQIETVNLGSNRITCLTCNQTFVNKDEQTGHKCLIPVVTITCPKNADENKNDVTKTEEDVDDLETSQNSRKTTEFLALSHNRFMESNKKTYDLQNRVKRTYSAINRNKHSKSHLKEGNIRSPQKQQNTQQMLIQASNQSHQIILPGGETLQLDANQLQALVADQQQQQQIDEDIMNSNGSARVLQIPTEQQVSGEANEELQIIQQTEQLTPEQAAAMEGGQLIMIQHPDGQCVQICVPEGMDLDEVLKSLNQSWPLDQLATDQSTEEEKKVEQAELNEQIELEQEQIVQQDALDRNQIHFTESNGDQISLEQITMENVPTEQIQMEQITETDLQIEQPQTSQIETELIEHHSVEQIQEISPKQVSIDQLQQVTIDQISENKNSLEQVTMDEIQIDPANVERIPVDQLEQIAMEHLTEQRTEQTELSGNHTLQMVSDQSLIRDEQQQITLNEMQLATVEAQFADDGEPQVIYLPVNEDGTCAIDAESLAMLTCNGEMPIIVSSTNDG